MTTQLLESIAALRAAEKDLRLAVEFLARQPKHDFRPLQEVVFALGVARPATSPPQRADCDQEWRDFVGGRVPDIRRRAVHTLCWNPEVGSDASFLQYVYDRSIRLSAKDLQGLVRSCHRRWGPELVNKQTLEKVRVLLQKYKGVNRVVSLWNSQLSTIMDTDGPKEFADQLVRSQKTVKEGCGELLIASDTLYVLSAVRAASDYSQDAMEADSSLASFFLESIMSWSGWPADEYKERIGRTILNALPDKNKDFRREVLRLVLRNPVSERQLGDPRLEVNSHNWVGIDKARKRVLRWLSELDIVFFFEHVMRRQEDKHGRKKFWLQYIAGLDKSRTLLNQHDLLRLRPVLDQNENYTASHGHLRGLNSAFFLDFGCVVAIEFNRVGACYVYQRQAMEKLLPHFWTMDYIREDDLKRKGLLPSHEHRVVHREGWQDVMRQLLAHHGVRP